MRGKVTFAAIFPLIGSDMSLDEKIYGIISDFYDVILNMRIDIEFSDPE